MFSPVAAATLRNRSSGAKQRVGFQAFQNTDIRQFERVDYAYCQRLILRQVRTRIQGIWKLIYVSFSYVKTDSRVGNPRSTIGLVFVPIGKCEK